MVNTINQEPQRLFDSLKSAEQSVQRLYDDFSWTKYGIIGAEPFVESIALHNKIHDLLLKISKRMENMNRMREGGRF